MRQARRAIPALLFESVPTLRAGELARVTAEIIDGLGEKTKTSRDLAAMMDDEGEFALGACVLYFRLPNLP